MNQHLLNMLGVGHSSLDTVISLANCHNLHAKLTGAGGGGCAFALIPPCESISSSLVKPSHQLHEKRNSS